MEIDEPTMQYLEDHFPELMEAAGCQAYWQALASGSSVLISVNGEITEVFPDGTRRLVKKNAPWVAVPKGKIITLKWPR